jgi:hypothetical protein
MRACAFRWIGVAAGLLLLSIPLSAQMGIGFARNTQVEEPAQQTNLGYPQDWSSHHLVMPGLRAEDALANGQDPRHVYNLVMRKVAERNLRVGQPILDGGYDPLPITWQFPQRRLHIDWSVSLENGYIPQNQFPAKYQFGTTSESCTGDYVIFGLTVSSGTQANLVGINNLYTEASTPCNSGKPWVSFAYNTVTQTGGQIKTSPELSADGKRVAFVESTSTGSYFHVLMLPSPIPTPGASPAQVGTVLSPQTPTSCTTPTTANCMTTLTIESTATNSNSSPWVDYNADTAYVGADDGKLYKITPVFRGGAPALVSNSDWPVTLAASGQSNKVLTAPIEDTNAGRIFVGDGYGYLYAVSLTAPAHTYAAQVAVGWVGNGAGTGIVDPPIAVNDPANPATDQVFAYTGCSSVIGIGGAVTQVPANFTSSTALTTSNTVDLGSGSGNGDCTGGNVHAGVFDNNFWVNGTTSGHMISCGFVSGTSGTPLKPSNPKMYFFPFASNTITGSGASTFVVNSTKGDECSPLTEFYNGSTDRLFFGVGSSSDGFVESSTITTSLTTPTCSSSPTSSCTKAPSALGGSSGIVIDNQVSNGGTNIYFTSLAAGSVNSQKCNVSGGSSNPNCAIKLTQAGLQ